ncbi:hypothetical protein ACJJTC_002761 [Scirpophaga incertulas]
MAYFSTHEMKTPLWPSVSQIRGNTERGGELAAALEMAAAARERERAAAGASLPPALALLRQRVTQARHAAASVSVSLTSTEGATVGCSRLYSVAAISSSVTKLSLAVSFDRAVRDGPLLYLLDDSQEKEKYMKLEVLGGKLRLRWQLGGGEASVAHPAQLLPALDDADHTTYRVDVDRIWNTVHLRVERLGGGGPATASNTSSAGATQLQPTKLWLGGTADTDSRDGEHISVGLPGCVHSLRHDDEIIGLWNFHHQPPNAKCSGCTQRGATRSSGLLRFDGNGYARVERSGRHVDASHLSVAFTFRTSDPDALLFYSADEIVRSAVLDGSGYIELPSPSLRRKGSVGLSFSSKAGGGLLLLRPPRCPAGDTAEDGHHWAVLLQAGELHLIAATGKAELRLTSNGTKFDDGEMHALRIVRAHKQLVLVYGRGAGGRAAAVPHALPARAAAGRQRVRARAAGRQGERSLLCSLSWYTDEELEDVQLQFRTHSPRGLLLAASGFVLELRGGKVTLTRYPASEGSAGSGVSDSSEASEQVVCDGLWHRAVLRRGRLALDPPPPAAGAGAGPGPGPAARSRPGARVHAGSQRELYVGGLPDGATEWDESGRENFKGCIKEVWVGGEERDLQPYAHRVLLDSCPAPP